MSGRRITARGIYVQDHVLTKLRDAAGFPLSTVELVAGLGPYRETRRAIHNGGGRGCPTCTCEEKRSYREGYWYSIVYTCVKRLERAGTLARINIDGNRKAYWSLVEAPSGDIDEELRALLERGP